MLKHKTILFLFLPILISCNLFAQKVKYEIFAIKFAERTNKTSLSEIAVGSKSTDSTQVCFMYWLLKGDNGKNILVDAGFSDDMEINPKFINYSSRPDLMLKNIGVKVEDITDIIITHPHWDHIGGIDLYPEAMVWMQENDYNYFVGTAWQKDGIKKGFNEKDVVKIVQKNLKGKLTLIKGDDKEILPNIKVFTGSKHTFESQFVLVDSDSEKVIIASDNSWFYYNLTSLLPIPITHNSKSYTKNLKRMRTMVKNIDFIIPGHDPLVFSKFKKVADNIVKIK